MVHWVLATWAAHDVGLLVRQKVSRERESDEDWNDSAASAMHAIRTSVRRFIFLFDFVDN